MIERILNKLRKSLLLRTAVIASPVVIFILFMLVPKQIDTARLAKQVDQYYRDNQRVQDMVLAKDHSGEKLQTIQENLKKYQNMVPLRTDLPTVLDDIASRAQVDGLEVLSLKPLRSIPYLAGGQDVIQQTREQLVEAVFDMKGKGRFFDVGRYMTDLENGPYKIIVHDLKLKSLASDVKMARQEPQLAIEITLGVLMRFPADEAVSL